MKLKLMFIFTLIYMTIAVIPVKAQVEVPSNPINLSRSGSTNSPTLIEDEEGTIHSIWMDEFSGILYSSFDGEIWSEPSIVTFPFDGYIPALVQNEQGETYAFWIDGEGSLRYSLVSSTEFGVARAWKSQQLLVSSVISFDVNINQQDGVHLTYIKSVESKEGPAGIYYKRTVSGGAGWQPSVNLYHSKYFRSASPDNVNVQIGVVSASEGSVIYTVWDDRPVKSVFFSRSVDGGITWDSPAVIAGPQVLGSSTTPYNIRMHAREDGVLLVYQNGQPGLSCTQTYLHSEDKGQTWSAHKQMLAEFAGCALDNRFLESTESDPILWTYIQEQVYLSAWDGSQWSRPQNHSEVSSFEDPNTRILITLNNPESRLGSDRALYVVGSDMQRGDVWWNKVELDDFADWFESENNWGPLEVVTSGKKQIRSIALTADSSKQIHAFWSLSIGDARGTPDSAIYYSRWERETLWSFPIGIQSKEQIYSDQPSVAIDPVGSLNLVWKAGASSEIYFSQAPSNLAVLSSSWSDPLLLSIPGHQAESPEIRVDQAGKLYVVYAAPINDERGIYLTTSDDNGQNWSTPVKVINSQDLGYSWVNNPHIKISDDGTLHLMWTNYQLISGQPQPVSILYSHSMDAGETWTAPDILSKTPLGWSSLEVTENLTVHRLWQEFEGPDLNIWHEYSLDGGNSWKRVKPYSFFGTKIGVPAISKDSTGRLHLFQLLQVDVDRYTLQHVIWDKDSWTNQTSKDLDLELIVSLGSPAAVVSLAGDLGVVFPAKVSNPLGEGEDVKLIFTHLSLGNLPQSELEGSASLPTPGVVETVLPQAEETTPVPTPGAVETVLPQGQENTPVPTPDFVETVSPQVEEITPTEEVLPLPTSAAIFVDNDGREINPLAAVIAGTLSAVFIIAVVVGIQLRNKANR